MTGQMRAMKIRYKCCCITGSPRSAHSRHFGDTLLWYRIQLCGASSNATFYSQYISTRYFLSLGITVVIAE